MLKWAPKLSVCNMVTLTITERHAGLSGDDENIYPHEHLDRYIYRTDLAKTFTRNTSKNKSNYPVGRHELVMQRAYAPSCAPCRRKGYSTTLSTDSTTPSTQESVAVLPQRTSRRRRRSTPLVINSQILFAYVARFLFFRLDRIRAHLLSCQFGVIRYLLALAWQLVHTGEHARMQTDTRELR